MGVCVPKCFQGGNSRVYARISVCVCGAEEVFAIFYNDVPDDDGVFDSSVFLI